MPKLNLLGLLPAYYGGGAEKVMLMYFNKNQNELLSFKLFVSNASGPLKYKFNQNNIEFRHKRFLYSIPKLLEEIKKNKINVLFSTFPNISVIIILLKLLRLHKCAIIVRQPNELEKSLSGSLKLSFLKFLYTKIIHKSDLIIVTSRYMKKEIYALNKKIKNIHLIRNPVNVKEIRTRVRPATTNKNIIRLIFVGRLVYQKGIDIVLNVIGNVTGLELIILGDGKERENLKRIVKEKCLGNKVSFLGFVDNPNNLIAGADYFILPSRWEGLPNSVLESLALGTPVIAFNRINGLKDYKNKLEKNSIIFCLNEKDLEKKLNKLKKRSDYNKPKLRKNLLKEFSNPMQYQVKLNTAILKLNEK